MGRQAWKSGDQWIAIAGRAAPYDELRTDVRAAHHRLLGLEQLGEQIITEVVRFRQLGEIFSTPMEVMRSTRATYLRQEADAGTLVIADPVAATRLFGMLVYGEHRERTLLAMNGIGGVFTSPSPARRTAARRTR